MHLCANTPADIIDLELHLKEVGDRHRLMVRFEARLGFGESELLPMIASRLQDRIGGILSHHPNDRSQTKFFGPLVKDRVPCKLVEDDLSVKKLLVTVTQSKYEEGVLTRYEEARWDYNRATPFHCEKHSEGLTYVKGLEVPLYSCGNIGLEVSDKGVVKATFEPNADFRDAGYSVDLLVHLVGYVYLDVPTVTMTLSATKEVTDG